jgi:hypothetical protein
MKILSIILRIVAAVIMLQTLFFKFTAAPESVYIFSKLGIDPIGRIGTGIIELISALLLFVPKRIWMGALLGTGTMAGAIMSHLLVLGINVQEDGGKLFGLAIITFVACVTVLFTERKSIETFIAKVLKNKLHIAN